MLSVSYAECRKKPFMLNVVMLNVVMLRVVAPSNLFDPFINYGREKFYKIDRRRMIPISHHHCFFNYLDCCLPQVGALTLSKFRAVIIDQVSN